MKNITYKKRSAFSLIELSIVLIIIGLLIAGITGGATLIRGSELRAAIGEARGYSVAVNAFYTQFDELPGEISTAVIDSTYDNVGDNNDLIEYVNAANIAEGAEARKDLFATGAITEVVTFSKSDTAKLNNTDVGTVTAAVDTPSSKIKNAGWIFDRWSSDNQNVVVLTGSFTGKSPTTSNTLPSNFADSAIYEGVVTPTDALSIDNKSDDGIPNSGNIRAITTNTTSKCYDTPASATTAGTFNVTLDDNICALAFSVNVK